MSELTEQQLFTHIVTAIVRQGRPSINGRTCMYRGQDGLKCAVGHVLLDEEYRPDMEGCGACTILPPRLEPFVGLLTELQSAHDDNDDAPGFVSAFLSDCRKCADARGLTMPVFP